MGLFGGGNPAKEAAKEARKAEERRQEQMRGGLQKINEIFYGAPIYETRTTPGKYTQEQVHQMSGYMPGDQQKVLKSVWDDATGGAGRSERSANPAYTKFQDIMARFGPKTERFQTGTSGGFDDAFYGKQKQAYEDYYMPQIEEQYGDAKTDLKAMLSGQGILNSSSGQRRFSDMLKDYEEGRRQISSKGIARADQARGRMEDIRSDLVGQLEGGMGIGSVTDIARAKAGALGAQPQYEPLADMFQLGTGVLANSASSRRAGWQNSGKAPASQSPFAIGSTRVMP